MPCAASMEGASCGSLHALMVWIVMCSYGGGAGTGDSGKGLENCMGLDILFDRFSLLRFLFHLVGMELPSGDIRTLAFINCICLS